MDTFEAKERLRKALEPLNIRTYEAEELFLAINALIQSRIADQHRRDDEE